MDPLFVTAAQAESLLVDFSCLLDPAGAEIAELRRAKVSAHRILNLYPFELRSAAAHDRLMDLTADPNVVRLVHSVLDPIHQYSIVCRYLPTDLRREVRSQNQYYDSIDVANSILWAEKEKDGEQRRINAERELALTLATLHALIQQPFAVDREFTDGERDALQQGLPLWSSAIHELRSELGKLMAALHS